MNIDPIALAQLPFAAFLILLGLTVAWLGSNSVWVWGRELTKSEKDLVEWKAIATKATETTTTQSSQIAKLTEMVDALTKTIPVRQP